MSEISANIIVETNPINVQVEQSEVGITVEPINLNIYSAGFSNPGGNLGELQYNAGILAGIPNVTYSGGNLSLGNIANVKILGGNTAYYLQTDGSGNLTWAAGTANVTGNGTAAGANNAIQLSDGTGNFKVGTGFNFDPSNNVLDIPGNATANYFIGNFFTGNGSGLSALAGANITGTVANATFALDAGNANIANIVSNNVQSNITSLGTLTELNVSGTTSISISQEKVTLSNSAPTGTINFDLISQAIVYNTANATGNITLNFRGNSSTTANSFIANSNSVVATYLVTTGANAYNISNVQIDGSAQTIKWASNITPLSVPNTISSYTFTLIKTATTPSYTVLGSYTRYG
jgi:hypothetical protein